MFWSKHDLTTYIIEIYLTLCDYCKQFVVLWCGMMMANFAKSNSLLFCFGRLVISVLPLPIALFMNVRSSSFWKRLYQYLSFYVLDLVKIFCHDEL